MALCVTFGDYSTRPLRFWNGGLRIRAGQGVQPVRAGSAAALKVAHSDRIRFPTPVFRDAAPNPGNLPTGLC